MEKKMFDVAGAQIFNNARELRNNLTNSEVTLCTRLKEFFPEYKFRRQHPIASFIADFYCHSLKLIIELNGSIHQLPEVKEQNEKRQGYFEGIGLTELRFTNDEMENQAEKVKEKISEYILNQFSIIS